MQREKLALFGAAFSASVDARFDLAFSRERDAGRSFSAGHTQRSSLRTVRFSSMLKAGSFQSPSSLGNMISGHRGSFVVVWFGFCCHLGVAWGCVSLGL